MESNFILSLWIAFYFCLHQMRNRQKWKKISYESIHQILAVSMSIYSLLIHEHLQIIPSFNHAFCICNSIAYNIIGLALMQHYERTHVIHHALYLLAFIPLLFYEALSYQEEWKYDFNHFNVN